MAHANASYDRTPLWRLALPSLRSAAGVLRARICSQEFFAQNPSLRADAAERRTLKSWMIWHGQRRPGAIRVLTHQCDVLALANDSKTKMLQRSDHSAPRCIDWELIHSEVHTRFGHEGLQDHGIVNQDVFAESFKVKSNGRLDISQRLFVGISFADDRTTHTKRISNIAVQMLLNNHFDLTRHVLPPN
jgi:hypothetical protein